MTPITTATNTPGRPIPVGGDQADNDPSAIAITPNGKTAYVVDTLGHAVTPITIATNTAGPAIPAGLDPSVIAITPNSKTAYVLNLDSVIPIATATNTAGRPVSVGEALCDRDHPQREDRVRHRLFRHSDPDRDRYQHPRGTDPGWQHPGRDRDHA